MVTEFPKGAKFIIWGRPESNLILLFGEGIYEGDTFVNGAYWPTIRLNNGREVTVHQHGISIGLADAVAATCKRFGGDVIEWDIDRFLRGEKPSTEQRLKPGSNEATLPPPRTATDKVMYIKREIELQESKKKLHTDAIAACDKVIAEKKAEIAALTQTVITELSAVNPDFMTMLAEQIAAKMKEPAPSKEAAVTSEQEQRPIANGVKPIIVELPERTDLDHHKLATED